MAKQNFNSGLEKKGPHRQGEKGGKGGTVSKEGVSGKAGKGTGTKAGGVSGGKRANEPLGERGKENPEGKGSGNR